MIVREGAWYATQRGRVVGPLKLLKHAKIESFWHDDYHETGIWGVDGRCTHPESKTGYSYGNLVCETTQPKQEETVE